MTVSVLGPGGYSRAPYGSFAGKVTFVPPAHTAGGMVGRYRLKTHYEHSKQRWVSLLEEIRDEEAVPTKAKAAVASLARLANQVQIKIAFKDYDPAGPDPFSQHVRLLGRRERVVESGCVHLKKSALYFIENSLTHARTQNQGP